ncbi:MAG: MOSC domain-containing protein [Myxococcota bacterium]|nr:MOSC domain-containing protein [Myxococcota bacterium]
MAQPLHALLRQLSQLPEPPRDGGRVTGLVIRPQKGKRLVVDQLELSPEGGIHGDRWGKRSHSNRNRQVSAIRSDVLSCLAGETPPELSGDNLHLTLDLSVANLPIGSCLQIGEVCFRVSPEVHNPCGQFIDRFGQSAHDATLEPDWVPRRARGVLLEVVEGGIIRLGDPVFPLPASATP